MVQKSIAVKNNAGQEAPASAQPRGRLWAMAALWLVAAVSGTVAIGTGNMIWLSVTVGCVAVFIYLGHEIPEVWGNASVPGRARLRSPAPRRRARNKDDPWWSIDPNQQFSFWEPPENA